MPQIGPEVWRSDRSSARPRREHWRSWRTGRFASQGNMELVNQSPAMKLIVAIVQDYDCDRLLRALSANGFRATRIASTGGFLRMGNTTVFMGVPDERVSACIDILKQTCRRRVDSP